MTPLFQQPRVQHLLQTPFENMRVFPENQTESRESMPFNTPRSNGGVAHEAAHVVQNDITSRKPRVEE
jgi:hypothetical protein